MKPNFLTKMKIALQILGSDFSGPRGSGTKSLPFPWPEHIQGKPQWHLQNYRAFAAEGYQRNSVVYSSIQYKVRSMNTAPLTAYTGNPDFPEKLPKDHPLTIRVTHPNPNQTWNEFHSLNMVYLNVAGNVYIWQNPLTGDLHSFRPDRMHIVPAEGPIASIDHFLYTPDGASYSKGVPLFPADVAHIKLPNPLDPLEGLGYGWAPLGAAGRSVDIDNMVTDFLKLFFERGSMITGILSVDMPLKEEVVDTIIERWNKKYGGYKKWGIGVLDRGAKYQRIGLTFEEMGFDSLDERNETRIMGPFGVPPILIGSRVGLARSTYSNYEGARRAVWEDTLYPEAMLYEVEYQKMLGGGDEFVQFDFSKVPAMQKDMPVLTNSSFTLFQMGVPANLALAAHGIHLGEIPNGDLPFAGAEPPPRGQGGQGPRAQEDDPVGMRALPCDLCGGELKEVAAGLIECLNCGTLTVTEKSNGRVKEVLSHEA